MHYKELAPSTKPKVKKLKSLAKRRAEGSHLSGGDGYETVDEEGGYTSGLEKEEESSVDIADTLGTRSDREGRVREIGMVGKRVG